MIEPLKHQSLLPTEKGIYEEIGIVIDKAQIIAEGIYENWSPDMMKQLPCWKINPGDKVFFDSWLAAKYPTGIDDEFIWLVPFKDIRAVEKKYGENTIPE